MSSGIPGLGSRLGHYPGLAKDIGGYYKYIPEGVPKNNIQRGQGDLLTSLTRDLEAWCQAWERHNNQHTAIQPTVPKTLDEIRNESGLLNTDLADGDNKAKAGRYVKGADHILETTGEISNKADLLRELKGVLEASRNLAFLDQRKPESWRETLQHLLQENQVLKSSLATKEETIRLLQARIETLSHAMMQKTKVQRKYQDMSLELKQIKKKEDRLEKLMEGKELFLTVKIHQVRSLQSHLTEIQQQNKTLKQTIKRLRESVCLEHVFRKTGTQPNMEGNHVGLEPEDIDLAQNVQETNITSTMFKQEFAQVIENLGQFSTKEDLPKHLKDFLEASNRGGFTKESAELTKSVPLGEPAQGLEEATETLEPSLVTEESTVRLLKEEIPRRPSSKPDTTTLQAQNQQMSSQIRQLKKDQAHRQKLIKGKDIFINAKNRQLCSLNKQLAEKEKENNTWKKIMRKLCHSATENIPLETEEDQKSAELRKLKKQQHALEKVMKAKGLVVKAKTHQVHTLEDTLLKKEEENSLLKQSVRKLQEAVSTLQMDIARLQQEQQKSLERAQEEKKAFEDTNMMMPKSFPEKEVAACERREEVPSGTQLLIEKEHTSQQLLSATESMLKKSPEFNQEREQMLLAVQQDHLKEVALQSAVKHSQDKLSQEPQRDHQHLAQSQESHVPEALQEEDGQAAVQTEAGAESSSLRALSSTPSAAGPVIESPCGEAQMPLPTLATCTASLSGQAEAKVEPKLLPAEPSLSTTGHKKLLATKLLGTVVWFNVKARYGFIRRHDIQQDIFVHHTAIKSYTGRYYLPSLADGEIVEFDVEEGQKGVQAANVTGPRGAAVRGSRYVAQWCRSRCLPRCRPPQRQTMQSHTEYPSSMYDNQAQPCWPQRCPRLLSCYQPRPYQQDSNKPLLGEGMKATQGPAAEKHQVHSQDQGEHIQAQQPPLSSSPCSQPHSLGH